MGSQSEGKGFDGRHAREGIKSLSHLTGKGGPATLGVVTINVQEYQGPGAKREMGGSLKLKL